MVAGKLSLLTRDEVKVLVREAARAPSIHNTQPWKFRWDGSSFEMTGDTQRGLTVIDPTGRELVISCGAALFNLRLALRKMGKEGIVELLPDRTDPRVLATISVAQAPPADVLERRLYAAMTRRHTHRGPFDGRPLSADLGVHLQHAAEAEGGVLLFVHEPGQRRRILHLARSAERLLSADPSVRAEIAEWTPAPDSARRDGIPAYAYSAEPVTDSEDVAPRDFDLDRSQGSLPAASQPGGGVAVLATPGDQQRDWLVAGMALERVLVVAAQDWAFAALHSQIVEVAHLREELRRELCTNTHPQLVMRFGYTSGARPLPRRPVEDVLVLPDS